jgi:hypothetical protein
METHWQTIQRLARLRGVNEATIKKWRQRGVPWKWRVILREDAKNRIPLDAFDGPSDTQAA